MRIRSIDGLRGISCIIVVFFHFFNETWKTEFPFYKNSIINFIFDGNLAVSIFFIISGYALSISFVKNGDTESIVRPAIKRWPRLSIPVFSSSIFVYLLYKFGFIFNKEAGIKLNSSWLRDFLPNNPDLYGVMKFSLITVFKFHSHNSLNPFLWTMHYELIGSIFLFITFFLIKNNKLLIICLSMLIFLCISDIKSISFILCFFIGYFFCFFKIRKKENYINFKNCEIIFFVSLFLISILFKELYYSDIFFPIKSFIIFFISLSSKKIVSFLESKPIQYLGEISFPLFLFQFPILVSFFSYLIVKYYIYNQLITSIIIALSGVAVSILVASVLSPVEIFTQKICDYFYFLTKSLFFKSKNKKII